MACTCFRFDSWILSAWVYLTIWVTWYRLPRRHSVAPKCIYPCNLKENRDASHDDESMTNEWRWPSESPQWHWQLHCQWFSNKITDLLASNDNDNDYGHHHPKIAPDNGNASSHDPLAKGRGYNLIAFNGGRVYDAIGTFSASQFVCWHKFINYSTEELL